MLVFLASTLAAPSPAEAQSGANVPWYGTADRARPDEGFSVRVPVTVENTEERAVRNRPVHVEMDFGKLLVDAGWTNQTVSGEARVRGFTLDVDSIRVVEYDRGFRAFARDPPRLTPHLFAPSLYTTSARGRDFDPAANPIGTVSWIVDGTVAPREKRYYMVYFSPLEHGKHAPAELTEAERSVAESIGWGGPANVLYGYENGVDTGENELNILALEKDTRIAVYVYRFSAFVLHEPDSKQQKNPFQLNESQSLDYRLPANTLYKIVSDKPIVAAGHGKRYTPPNTVLPRTFGEGAYISSTDRSWKGTEFTFPIYSPKIWVFATEGGTSTVQIQNAGTYTVSSGRPFAEATIFFGGNEPVPENGGPFWSSARVTSGPPVMLMYGGGTSSPSQAVPNRYGGPIGTDFYGRSTADGGVTAFAFDPAFVRVLDPVDGRKQLEPAGTIAETQPAAIDAGLEKPLVASGTPEYPVGPIRVLSVPVAPFAAGDVVATLGGPGAVGALGGRGGLEYLARGPVTVVAQYNETRVKVTEQRPAGPVSFTRSLSADQILTLAGPSGTTLGRYHIESTKPVVVLQTTPTDTYARYLTGRLAPISATKGPAEFRGRLVDIEAPGQSSRQIFATTGPNQPVDFQLRVTNLGRWIGGENLADTIKIKCESDPKDYEATGACGREFTLASLSAQTFTVTVLPKDVRPTDTQKNPGTVVVTAVSSSTNVTAKIRLIVRVDVKYGVGLWIDREGGLKEIDPPTSIDPGETATYSLVLKNLGSVADAFELRVSPPTEGWVVELKRGEREARSVTLERDATAILTLTVKAPSAKTASFNQIDITAKSVASSTAADKLTIRTRIRPDIKFALVADERTKLGIPNETVAFNLTVFNRGNDIFTVNLERETEPPAGWEAFLTIPEITLGPAQSQRIPLHVKPPADARAGDLATINVRGESTIGGGATSAPEFVAATVLVRQVHNVTLPTPLPIPARPGDRFFINLSLTNDGNGNEVLDLDRASVKPFWDVSAPAGDLAPLPYKGQLDYPLSVLVPPRTEAGAYNLTFTLLLSREGKLNVTLPIEVATVRRAEFAVDAPLAISPGQEYDFTLTLRSRGNVEDAIALRSELPAGWQARFVPENVTLNATEEAKVVVFLNASADAADGSYTGRLVALSRETGARNPTEIQVTVARPSLTLGRAEISGSLSRGNLVLVSAPVANRGAIEAKDVRVALVVDGEIVDVALLSRIPVNTEKLATVKWTVGSTPESIRLVLDPEGIVANAAVAGTAIDVETSRGVPAIGLLGIAAAAVAATFGSSRRRRE